MGERVLCKHEVVGSIPSASTRRKAATNGDRQRPGSEISDERDSRYPLIAGMGSLTCEENK